MKRGETVDGRHGKRPLPSNESADEDEDPFPNYSAQSQHDMSAIVSALSQVMGNTDTNLASLPGNPSTLSDSSNAEEQIQPQPVQQGTKILAFTREIILDIGFCHALYSTV